jgi:transcriptional regulator with XRE-family HTH domain
MTEVMEARQRFDNTRAEAAAMVARDRARLGLTMIRARERAGESQTTIARQMGIGSQQVRAYEQAYREWAEKHPGESLD